MTWTPVSESTTTWAAGASSSAATWAGGSTSSVPWWQLSGVTDNESSYSASGVDFRLRLSDDAGLLVSSETARALLLYDSQVSQP